MLPYMAYMDPMGNDESRSRPQPRKVFVTSHFKSLREKRNKNNSVALGAAPSGRKSSQFMGCVLVYARNCLYNPEINDMLLFVGHLW